MNLAQRINLFVFCIAFGGVVFLHFPFSGYEKMDEERYVENENRHLCPSIEQLKKEEEALGRPFTISEQEEKVKYCYMGEYVKTHFYEMNSKSPIVSWFGSVLNSLVVMIFVSIICGFFNFLFKEKASHEN